MTNNLIVDTTAKTTVMKAEAIYDLKLHETYHDDSLLVSRVPGGWVYTLNRLDCNQMNSVFIPWHTEFQPSTEGGAFQ